MAYIPSSTAPLPLPLPSSKMNIRVSNSIAFLSSDLFYMYSVGLKGLFWVARIELKSSMMGTMVPNFQTKQTSLTNDVCYSKNVNVIQVTFSP